MLLAASVSCSGFFFASLFVCVFFAIRNCALILALKLQQILWINAPTAWQMSCIKYKICPAGMGETETERERWRERPSVRGQLCCSVSVHSGDPQMYNLQLQQTHSETHSVTETERDWVKERRASLTWNCSLNTELCPSFWQHTNVLLYYVNVPNYSSKFCKWGVSCA